MISVRTKVVAGLAVLLCALLCARPVAAAVGVGEAEERNVRVVKTGPFGYVRWIEAPSPSESGKRYWVLPSYEYASWDEYARFRDGYVVTRLGEPPRGVIDSYQEAGGLIRMVGMAVGNRDLFMRGFRDVWRAVNESADLFEKGMGNLNDVQRLYEFWKEKGIYDKYNAGERAFLNQVVMPAVAAAQWALTGLGGAVTGAGALAGIALLLGATVGPALLAAGAGLLAGITVVTLVAHLKGEAVREEGGDVNAVEGLFPMVTAGNVLGGLVPTLLGGVASLLELAAGALGAVGVGIPTIVAGYLTAQQQYNLLATYNAYGIPELVETPVPPAVWETRSR
ncbi:MAG: hypothetical protein AB1816_16395, partial [Bacillota bacterium]